MSTQLYIVSFRFALRQEVRIKALGLKGCVYAVCRRGDGMEEYRVIYWSEGKRCDEWLFDYEIEEL